MFACEGRSAETGTEKTARENNFSQKGDKSQKPASPARVKRERDGENGIGKSQNSKNKRSGILSFFEKCRSHPWTPIGGGVEHTLRGVRVSLLDWRVAGTPLLVRDLLHHHLLVVGRLGVAHTRGAVRGIAGPVAEGGSAVGAIRVSGRGVAGRGGGVLRGHDLGVLMADHLAVGHDRHLGWHGSEPLHGDHAMGHAVERHDWDPG